MFPWAVTCSGRAVDEPTVLIFNKAPVRVLPVVSMKENALEAGLPVSAPSVQSQSVTFVLCAAHVIEVVSPVGCVKDKLAVGAVSPDHGTPVAVIPPVPMGLSKPAVVISTPLAVP